MQNNFLSRTRWLKESGGTRSKTNVLRYAATLLLIFTLGIGNAWGACNTYTLGWGNASGSNSTNFSAASGSVQNLLSFSTAKNSSNNAPAYNSTNKQLRCYYASNGSGGSITITPVSGVTITGFVLTSATTPTTKYKIGTGTATAVTYSSKVATVTGIAATNSKALTIQNCNTSNTQLQISTIQISYCYEPTSLTNTSVSSTSATLSWTDTHNVNSYEVYRSTSNTAPAANATPTSTVTTKSVSWDNLTANTTYYWWVRSKCADDCKSAWIAGTSFKTPAASAYTVGWSITSGGGSLSTTSGTSTTVTPTNGWRYASPAYTVLTGSATVAQSTNTFTATPTANSTIRINMEEIPSHNVIFNTGGLVSIANASVLEGATYNIPNSAKTTVEGALTGSCEYGTFVGWTTSSSIANASVCPTIVTSVTMSTSNINLYAVFSKTTGGSGTPTAYSAGDTGDFVIASYNTSNSKWYAIPTSPTLSSNKIAGVEITVNNTGGVNYVTTTNASGYSWTIGNHATYGQTLSDGTKYLYHSNGGASGTDLAYGNSTLYSWVIASEANDLTFQGAIVANATPSSRGMLMSGTTFGGYALSNEDASGYYRIQVLPIANSGTTTYSLDAGCNTIVNLTAATVTNGTVTLSSASLTTTSSAQTVNVTCTPNAGYYVSGISATDPATMPSGSVTTGGSGNNRTVTYPTGSAGSSTITVTFSPIWQLRGTFNSWAADKPMTTIEGTGANTVASISLTLSAMTEYEFKFFDASETNADEDYKYYGNPGAIITDISGWQYYNKASDNSKNKNTGLYTGPAGSYTFKINLSTKVVQVIYPTNVTHPVAGYAYFLRQGNWTGFKVYNYTNDQNRLTDWAGSPAVTNTTEICGNTYYYCALATKFDYVKFRDNGSNEWKAIALSGTGFSKKYCGDDYSADPQTWKAFGTYTITYAAGSGGEGTMEAMSGICPTNDRTLTANAFTKTDYSFAGWKANKDVTIGGSTVTAGTIIPDGATIQNIISNITLTAQWVHVPVLTVSTASIAFGTKGTGYSYTETFTVRGQYLTDDISIAVSGAQAAMFSVDPATLTQSSGTVNTTTVTVTYSPTSVASHSATITISTPGASETIALSGTGRKEDRFIDLVQNTTGYSEASPHIEAGTTYSTPTLTDKTQATSGTCSQLHYHFVGWITKAKYDAGTSIAAGDIQSPTSANNKTYYAVWAQEGEGGTPYYQKVTSTGDITTDGRYLIVYETGNLAFNGGLTTLDATDNYITVATITDSKITPATAAARTAHAAAEFTIGVSNSDYYLKSASNKYINHNGWSNGLGAYDAITVVHSISIDGSGNFVVEGTGKSGESYVTLRYNKASDQKRFRFFKSGQEAIQLYKYSPGISWEDYTASCGSTYTITLKKNNSSATADGVATVTANAAQLNSGFTAPVRAGFQVEGYYTSANCTTKVATAAGVLQPSITVSGTDWTDANGKWIKGGDATFYASWEAKQCVITLNNQDATTAGTTSVTATYNATTNLTTSITKPEKTGYDFGGYWTGVSGSGVQLVDANGAWIANVSGYTGSSKKWILDDTALELYAKWTTKTYTVNWYVNGVSVASETPVNYGALYSNLTNEPTVADNALSTCGSTKFIGWVTAAGQYTASGGTKAAQYDPYAVTGSTTIGDDTKDFYAMFAEEGGSVFDLSVTSGDFKIYGIYSDDSRYYATGALSSGGYSSTTTASDGDDFTFTQVSEGVYTIKHKRSNKFVKYSSSTDFTEATTSENWTITAANHGSWKVVPASATSRAFIMRSSGTGGTFKPYATSNITNTPAQYYYIEIGNSVFSNYRTGCCSEKITLNVTGATNSTYTLKFNGSAQTSGASVSTCAQSSVEFKITANAGYTLTGMSISGTNKTLTITPDPINTGLPSTDEKTYTVSIPALATGTLTITPTIAQTYSVTYDLAGGETSGSTAVARYQSGSTVTLVTPDPTKTGYNFTGWTVTKEGGGTVSVSSGQFTMPAANVTVTAGWTAKSLSSISLTPATAEVYVGQYVEIPVTYDPADILTKGYTLVASPSYCVTTGSTNNTLKITGGRGGVTITEDKVETVSIKADADNTKTASVTVTVKPLPVDHFLDLVHGATFADQTATIVNNALSAAYTAPSYEDVEEPAIGNACEKGHLHLVGWIESEWADANLTATMAQIKAAKDADNNALFHTAYSSMTASNKTYYAVWGHEVTP